MISQPPRRKSGTPVCPPAWPSAWPSAGERGWRGASERWSVERQSAEDAPTLRRSTLHAPMKVLILKPSSLGDVVQALPVLRLIKRNLPASEIYWWIDSNLASLLEDDADLSGIIRFDRRQWAAPRHWLELWRGLRWMRAQSFDWVIDLQSLARSGTFAWLANGSLTIGLDEPRECARGYYDVAVRRPSL